MYVKFNALTPYYNKPNKLKYNTYHKGSGGWSWESVQAKDGSRSLVDLIGDGVVTCANDLLLELAVHQMLNVRLQQLFRRRDRAGRAHVAPGVVHGVRATLGLK